MSWKRSRSSRTSPSLIPSAPSRNPQRLRPRQLDCRLRRLQFRLASTRRGRSVSAPTRSPTTSTARSPTGISGRTTRWTTARSACRSTATPSRSSRFSSSACLPASSSAGSSSRSGSSPPNSSVSTARGTPEGFQPCSDPKKPDTAPPTTTPSCKIFSSAHSTCRPSSAAFARRRRTASATTRTTASPISGATRPTSATAPTGLDPRRPCPFLNGGLFDCLDDKTGKKKDNFILDGFSDNPKLGCHLPNDLFFGPERTVDLSRRLRRGGQAHRPLEERQGPRPHRNPLPLQVHHRGKHPARRGNRPRPRAARQGLRKPPRLLQRGHPDHRPQGPRRLLHPARDRQLHGGRGAQVLPRHARYPRCKDALRRPLLQQGHASTKSSPTPATPSSPPSAA